MTPDSNGAIVYHNHVQDKPPFFFGCYGPNDDGSLVTVEQCRAVYANTVVPNAGGKKACDGVLASYTLASGTFEYDDWCPCCETRENRTGA